MIFSKVVKQFFSHLSDSKTIFGMIFRIMNLGFFANDIQETKERVRYMKLQTFNINLRNQT
jgi:hypothetical protein